METNPNNYWSTISLIIMALSSLFNNYQLNKPCAKLVLGPGKEMVANKCLHGTRFPPRKEF